MLHLITCHSSKSLQTQENKLSLRVDVRLVHRRLAAGPDLRGALLAMAYLAQFPMTAQLLQESKVGASVTPLRQVGFSFTADHGPDEVDRALFD